MPKKKPELPAPAPPGPQRCTARSKRSGEQCKRWATPGAAVCRMHGGKAPQVEAAARRRLQAAEAAADLATFGVALETTPVEALEAMLWEAAGNVAVLRQLVNTLELRTEKAVQVTLDDHDDTVGVYLTGTAIAGQMKADSTAAAPHVWVVMYNAERDRLAKLAEACAKLGLDERRVQLAEAQVAKLFDHVTGAIADCGLNAEQTARFKQSLAARIRGGE